MFIIKNNLKSKQIVPGKVNKPLLLVIKVLYLVDRSVYLVDKSVYFVNRSLYFADRSEFLVTTSPTLLSNAWIWDWSNAGSFNKILFSAIACTINISRKIEDTIVATKYKVQLFTFVIFTRKSPTKVDRKTTALHNLSKGTVLNIYVMIIPKNVFLI